MVFCKARIKFISCINNTKLLNPTKVLSADSPPHFNVDIQKTLRVGKIMNTPNKITAGARHKIMNLRLSFFLFIAAPTF